jgi:membrane-associated protease RseP (regulator of RpoE activity)
MKAMKWTVLPMFVGAISALCAPTADAQMPYDYNQAHAYEAQQSGYFPGRQKQGLNELNDSGAFDYRPPNGAYYGGYYAGNPTVAPNNGYPQNEVVHYLGHEHARLGVSLSESSQHGVRITNVASGSPAAHAGLQAGDRILGINHQTTNSYRDVIRIINNVSPGSRMVLHLDRNGRIGDVTATLDGGQQQMQASGNSHYTDPRQNQ